MKCMAPTYMGDFALPGRELRLKGQNRIGKLGACSSSLKGLIANTSPSIQAT